MAEAIENLGPHLLGRVPSPPDARDWKMADYLVPVPDDALLGKTVQEAIQEGFFSSWPALLIFWRWVKKYVHPWPTPKPPPAAGKSWHDAIQLDQGQTGHCVGFGWAAWGNCAPVEDSFGNAVGDAVYYAAKVIDGEPTAENGSSVRSGAKAMKNRGRLGAYVFASTEDEVATWIRDHGPVVIGSDWTEDMFLPDHNGVVRPTGAVAGGHCYLLLGYDQATDLYEFDNSWGSGWGKGGRFFMTGLDFHKLVLADPNGEACAGVELP